MQKIIFYIIIMVFSFLTKAVAQEERKDKIEERKEKIKERKEPISNKLLSFEKKVLLISTGMEFLLAKEKNELKIKIDSLETIFKQNKISEQEFKDLKLKEAEKSASRIEFGMEFFRVNLDSLIQKKIEKDSKEITLKIDTVNGKKVYAYSKNIDGNYYDIPIPIPNLKVAKSNKTQINLLDITMNNDSIYKNYKKEHRTTTQIVIATGFNNLVTNGAIANSDFGYLRSGFWEWGVTLNTRLSKNSNLLHLKYGLGFQYNMLHATDNRVFVDTGSETVLETYPIDLKDNHTYFRNVYFVLPVHLEFDFSKTEEKDGKKIFKSHQGFRFGLGGFAGVNTNSKQFIRYELDGKKVRERTKADFNVNDFTYGLSTYVGYKATSLYVKYDLNPMFKNNNIDQNNVSLGLRFDFN
jgi:hypothetical protein